MSEKEIKKELKEIRVALEELSKTLIAVLYQFMGRDMNGGDEETLTPKFKSNLSKNPPNNFNTRSYVG